MEKFHLKGEDKPCHSSGLMFWFDHAHNRSQMFKGLAKSLSIQLPKRAGWKNKNQTGLLAFNMINHIVVYFDCWHFNMIHHIVVNQCGCHVHGFMNIRVQG